MIQLNKYKSFIFLNIKNTSLNYNFYKNINIFVENLNSENNKKNFKNNFFLFNIKSAFLNRFFNYKNKTLRSFLYVFSCLYLYSSFDYLLYEGFPKSNLKYNMLILFMCDNEEIQNFKFF